MKKNFCAILIMLFVVTAAISFAQDYPCDGNVNSKAVNVRKTPYSKGVKVTQLSNNTPVTVLSETTDKAGNIWYSIQTSDGKSGYILAEYVTLAEENTEIVGTPLETTSVSGTSFPMDLAVSASCKNYNHVGNSWTQYYELNGEKIENKKATAEIVPGSFITLYSRIKEQDSKPDVGTKTTEYTPTQQELTDGFTVEQKVTVTENGGKYSGKSATWTVVFEFTPKK